MYIYINHMCVCICNQIAVTQHMYLQTKQAHIDTSLYMDL